MEGQTYAPGDMVDFTADAAYSDGDIIQVPDGRAGVVRGAVASGSNGSAEVTEGLIVTVPKTTSMVMLISSELFWDHSANKAHLLHGGDRDFFLGTCQKDETSSATTVRVALNKRPRYAVSLADGFATIPIQTAGFPVVHGAGEGVNLQLQAANEAQKIDALSIRSITVAGLAECIGHALICVNDNGGATAADTNIGFANGTHATDADSITEAAFVHLDGNDLNISLASRDGTTTVAITDSTIDFVEGTPFLVQWDFRNLADIQTYVNGVLALPSSVFKLDAAAGPIKALAHMEKTSSTDTYRTSVVRLGLTAAQNMLGV